MLAPAALGGVFQKHYDEIVKHKDGEEAGYKEAFAHFNMMMDAGMINKKGERSWKKFLKTMRVRIDMNSVDKSVRLDEETFVHVLFKSSDADAFDMREVAESLRIVDEDAQADGDGASTIQLEHIVSADVREELAAIEAAASITAPTPPRRSTRKK